MCVACLSLSDLLSLSEMSARPTHAAAKGIIFSSLMVQPIFRRAVSWLLLQLGILNALCFEKTCILTCGFWRVRTNKEYGYSG